MYKLSVPIYILWITDLPVAQSHKSEEYEDTANTSDQYDHHDDCVAVRLFDWIHTLIWQHFFWIEGDINDEKT